MAPTNPTVRRDAAARSIAILDRLLDLSKRLEVVRLLDTRDGVGLDFC